MAAAGGVVAWGCSAMVILGVVTYVFFEILKRWRVGLRLSALDESLLHDDGVSIESITEAPMGSWRHSETQLLRDTGSAP